MATALKTILANLVPRLPISRKLEEIRIVESWPAIVGEPVASHTKARQVTNSILWVTVENPVWGTELNFLKQELILKINHHFGKIVIRDIRFHVGEI